MIFSFKPNENTRIHIRDKTGVEHKQNLSHSYQLKKKKKKKKANNNNNKKQKNLLEQNGSCGMRNFCHPKFFNQV